ncbi:MULTISPECIES: hypothetical protein [unclassified Maridesulfovibrio]|uniref:hypothetical protein n=1 Tax=unclassified Maridesulfovibrio TaxID=2794999 RepID=UPI003B3C231C
MAELTGAATPEELNKAGIYGKSLVPVMKDPKASVRDRAMFFTEDCESLFAGLLGIKKESRLSPHTEVARHAYC